MAHSYVSCLMHYVFSTKERQKLVTPALQERLYPYMGGIARELKMKAIAIGGALDHMHILLSLASTMSIAKAIQLIKGNSSKWIHETFPDLRRFEWQEGYGAFSIGVSQMDATVKYIENQTEHHRRKTFQEEFIQFLEKHGIDYDPRYIWD